MTLMMKQIRRLIPLLGVLVVLVSGLLPHAALAQSARGRRIEINGEHARAREMWREREAADPAEARRQREALKRAFGKESDEARRGREAGEAIAKRIRESAQESARSTLGELEGRFKQTLRLTEAERQRLQGKGLANIGKLRERPPQARELAPHRATEAFTPTPGAPPALVAPPSRPAYGQLYERMAKRLAGQSPLVMNAADLELARGRLVELRAAKPAERGGAGAKARIDFDGDFAVIHLATGARTEIIQVEMRSGDANSPDHRRILQEALTQLSRILASSPDRVEKVVWAETNYAAMIDGKPISLIPPKNEGRRDRPARARVATR